MQNSNHHTAGFLAFNVRAFLLLVTGICLILANSPAAYWCAVGLTLVALGISFAWAASARQGMERIVGCVSGISIAAVGLGGIVGSIWNLVFQST